MNEPSGVFYAIASRETGKAFDWYPTRAKAEAALAEVIVDEPGFEPILFIAEVDLTGAIAQPGARMNPPMPPFG